MDSDQLKIFYHLIKMEDTDESHRVPLEDPLQELVRLENEDIVKMVLSVPKIKQKRVCSS